MDKTSPGGRANLTFPIASRCSSAQVERNALYSEIVKNNLDTYNVLHSNMICVQLIDQFIQSSERGAFQLNHLTRKVHPSFTDKLKTLVII